MDLATIQTAISSGLAPLQCSAPLRLSEWAEKYFYLSAESSYVEQQWKSFPYQVAMLDAMSNDAIREVALEKSARVGYTKMILAATGYFAQHRRRNQCVWQPTDDDADEYCKIELEPMLRDVPIMRKVFPEFIAKSKANTLRQKKLLGCVIHLRGGKAAKNYRRLSLDVAILDELDAFDSNVEKEGDPVMLSAKRIEGATFPKQILGSTPHLKGTSLIAARREQAALNVHFVIPCPHCDHEHPLTWGGKGEPHGMKWTGRDASSIRQMCPACGGLYDQGDYLRVWGRGRWVSEDGTWIDQDGRFMTADGVRRLPPRSIGFHVWTAYSPQTPWEQIAHDWFAAVDKAKRGDREMMKTFINTTLGEAYEEPSEKTSEHELKSRAESYALRLAPAGVLVMVAGVDVQDDRFEVVVWGYGRGMESWVIDYAVIYANPADERDWLRLDDYLVERIPVAGGGSLPIEAAAVDTGGHFTHQAYNFCRARSRRRVFAIKGDNKPGQKIKGNGTPQDVNHRGKIIKQGVRLYMVGTDTAKDLLFGRLRLRNPGPGYVHFSSDLSDEFYLGLTAEQRVLKKLAKGYEYAWTPIRDRNEPLDCTVYAMFCASAIGLDVATESRWARMEQSLKDNVIVPVAPVEPLPDAIRPMTQIMQPARPSRGGWVRGWRP